MTTTEPRAPADYKAILAAINAWPLPYRLALMQEILRVMTPEMSPTQPSQSKHGFERARGLLASDQPPPSDEEVEQWLEEHRMEKYGPC